MPRDGSQSHIDAAAKVRLAPLAWHCAACGHRITRQDWAIRINGDHQHVVFNPAGIIFRVVCFAQAPGALAGGPTSEEFTWFRGYRWQLAGCGGCRTHLGWHYRGEGPPASFFGLIRPKLVERPE
jgi:hypothetical protein